MDLPWLHLLHEGAVTYDHAGVVGSKAIVRRGSVVRNGSGYLILFLYRLFWPLWTQ